MYNVCVGKEKLDDASNRITDSKLLNDIESSIFSDSVLDEIPGHIASKSGTT